MSIVFDARKHAEISKRARDAIAAHTSESIESRPQPSVLQDPVPTPQESRTESQPTEKARRHRKVVPKAASEACPKIALGLSAKRRAADWRVRWNRNAVANAIRGRLTISDGMVRKELELDSVELLDGSIIYTPEASDVVLRLEVVTSDSPVPSTESLRLIGDTPLPGTTTVETEAARAASNAIPPDLPPSSEVPDEQSEQLTLPIVGALLRAKRQSPSLPSQLAAKSPTLWELDAKATNNSVQPAALVFSAEPPYPQTARDSQITGSVEVHFRISPEGRVYNAKSVRGPAVLARAAIEALQTWRYAPARLHGAPIDSQGSANFEFNLS